MTHLRIEQSSQSRENIDGSAVSLLYQKVKLALDQGGTVNIEGWVKSSYAYDKDAEYLQNNTNLQIDTDALYIKFEDTKTQAQLLSKGIGDGVGITRTAAANTELREDILSGADIEYFDELQYFNIGTCRNLFKNTYGLKRVTFPKNKYLWFDKDAMFSYDNRDATCEDIIVDWNGSTFSPETIANRSNHIIYNGLKNLTWKDGLIPPGITDFTYLRIFASCKSIDRVLYPEGAVYTDDSFYRLEALEYVEFPYSVTSIGSAWNIFRDGRVPVMVIKAITPPSWTRSATDMAGWGGGICWGRIPTAIYVPDNSVNIYKNTPSGDPDANNNIQMWGWENVRNVIKPLSELPQQYRDMGTVTQEDIDRV